MNEPKPISELITLALIELRNEKICLIEDIFKVRRMSFGLEIHGNNVVIENPTEVFDELYELTNESLELELAARSALMARKARILAGIDKSY